jgi:hypothetical protein
LRGGFRRCIARQFEHLLHMLKVLCAQFLETVGVTEVVVYGGQRHATLVDAGDYLGGILEILR